MKGGRMRGIFSVVLVFALVFGACSRVPTSGHPVEVIDARESVYQVRVRVDVDVTLLLKALEEEEAASEGGPDEELRTLRLLSSGETGKTVTLEQADGTKFTVGWTGTAWVAERNDVETFLMTAGHVCESRKFWTVEFPSFSKKQIVRIDLPIVSVEHDLISRNNSLYRWSTVIRDEDLDESDYSGLDLCMLGVVGDLGRPLPLANQDPEYASHSEVIGAPMGLWGGGVAVIADLKFAGRGNVWGGNVAEGLAFTGDVAGGNSGSAIMHRGRVVALLNLGGARFKELTTGVPWEEVAAFMDRARHREK